MKYSEYNEGKQHGTSSFPLQFYSADSRKPNYPTHSLHWHREFEISRVLDGEVAMYINNVKHILRAGDVVFIGCGVLHRQEILDGCCETLVFNTKIVSGYNTGRISELIQPIVSSDAEISIFCPEANDVVNELFDLVQIDEKYIELKITSLISEIFYRLYKNGAVKVSHLENKRFAHRREIMTILIDYIEKNYTHRITLADLAEISQINEKYLCRFFKEFTGMTPIDYINRLRVDRACYDMTVNKRNVTEAAYENGFNELSYFSKCFKKYKGVSPGQYRSKITE